MLAPPSIHLDNSNIQFHGSLQNEFSNLGQYQGESDIKEKLRCIWADVLHDDPSLYTDEDVFFEVGGDSISAQKLVTASRNQGLYLTMEQIFTHASLAEMAEVVSVEDTSRTAQDIAFTTELEPFSSYTDRISPEDLKESIAIKCDVAVEDIDNAYPCSPMQESLLLEYDGGKNLYVRQFVFKLATDIPLDKFRQAWDDTIKANAILRTRICQLDGGIGYVQAVLKYDGHWTILNVGLDHYLEWDSSNHMLAGEPFFRYTILEDKDSEGGRRRHFVWIVHHALCDGVSIPETFHDVSRKFEGKAAPRREGFESFVRSPAIMPDRTLEEAFWRRALSDINPTPYPPVPQDPGFRAEPTSVLERTLTLSLTPAHGVTRALLVRAAWAVLLSHYSGTEDVGFGAINNGRTAEVSGVSNIMGPTINLVPIALHVDPNESVPSFLSRVRLQAAEMISFEHSGISRIRKYLARDNSTAVDFQSLLVVHPMTFPDAIAPATKALGLEYVDELGKKEQHSYPLVLTLTLSSEEAVTLTVQHDDGIISTDQALRITHHLQVILTQLNSATRDTKLGSISPFGVHDKTQIQSWNNFTPPVEETCIHSLFQKQAVKQPNAVAVCSVDESLTYHDVDTCSSSLAVQLLESGVSVGTYVGVCFEKSIWTVVAILAVFKAGGVYVPIDPAHPRGRIEDVIRTVNITVALASQSGAGIIRELCHRIITVHNRPLPLPDVGQPFNSLPSSMAYLLFTSGSTGKPKGILMPHSAICTSILHHGAAFAANPRWRTLQFGAHTFDLSIGEFFTTLAHGGCICVPSEHDRLNNLAGAISSLRANTLLVVPTVANLIFPAGVPTLKTIVLAGEPITKETVARWADSVDLTCAYGPSETAVWCSGNLRVTKDAHPGNIGRSIGATMWIVNPENYHQLSAIGCVGEIAISGPLLGGGYFDDKATTDAAFVPAPQWMREMNPDSSAYNMLYKSGDLARYNSDGTFQIVGRRDTQVKLRGFRIELGEIENQIMVTGRVTAALAALPTAGPCARQIVAVVSSAKSDLRNHGDVDVDIVVSEETRSLVETLKAHLALSLPEYMIPSVWIVLTKMPLLISGKIDRRSLKSWVQNIDHDAYRRLIEVSEAGEATEILSGSLADTLRHLWGESLNVPPESIGLKSSFIALGGDSIAAIQIISRAKKLGLSLTVRGMISSKTLGNLVTLVEQSSHSVSRTIAKPTEFSQPTVDFLAPYQALLNSRLKANTAVRVEDAYVLAPFQREIMKARNINPGVFLLSWQMEVFSLNSETISLEKLAQSWRRVVQRHPILRSIFLQDPTGSLPAVQVVLAGNVEPEIAICSGPADEPEPCFVQTQTPPNGWSLKLIKEDFLAAYEGEDYKLEEPPSYKSFVAVHHPARVETDDRHWATELRKQKPSLLSLPVASSNSPRHQHSLEKTIIYLPEIQAQALKLFSVQNDITPASIFDAAWAQTLCAHTQSSDVTFEYVISGREEDMPGIFDIVGPLINVLPYHLEDVSCANGSENLARLAQRMQEQRARDGLHTSSNVRDVIQKDPKMDKLFNTALNFQRRPTAVETGNIKIDDDLRKSRDPWHFDVLVRVMHITDDDTFKSSFEFDPLFFDNDLMKGVAEDFWRRIASIIG